MSNSWGAQAQEHSTTGGGLPRLLGRFGGEPRAPDRSAALDPQQAFNSSSPVRQHGGNPEQEYFADGISEDIITALSHYRWFFVIARNSTFVYKGRSVDVKQVAREPTSAKTISRMGLLMGGLELSTWPNKTARGLHPTSGS